MLAINNRPKLLTAALLRILVLSIIVSSISILCNRLLTVLLEID